jgi:membrane protein implicated in regulation of membrane protease activity
MTPDDHSTGAAEAPSAAAPKSALSEKQRRELWLYIAVSIAAVELLIAVGAVFFGFLGAGARGARAFAFPWLSWGASAVLAPALILLLVHLADVGLFRSSGKADSDEEWQKRLPERMRRIYRIVKGAPVVVVLLGIVLLAAAVMTLDGALAALRGLGEALIPYIPHIVVGLVVLAAVIIVAAAWLSYRTRRLMAEYEFRREVLEKTGVIIVDKGSTPLPPGGTGEIPYAIAAAEDLQYGPPRALPEGPTAPDASRTIDAESATITAEATEIPPDRAN